MAGAIAAFASGYSPGQRAIVGAGGLPKLTQLLTSHSPAVLNKTLSALLVCSEPSQPLTHKFPGHASSLHAQDTLMR